MFDIGVEDVRESPELKPVIPRHNPLHVQYAHSHLKSKEAEGLVGRMKDTRVGCQKRLPADPVERLCFRVEEQIITGVDPMDGAYINHLVMIKRPDSYEEIAGWTQVDDVYFPAGLLHLWITTRRIIRLKLRKNGNK